MKKAENKWKFAVDRGGTFTDVVACDPAGTFHTLKLLSRSPGYDDASIEGPRRILGLEKNEYLDAGQIEGIRFGTTVATNALLERKGCRVALVITRGFSDLIEIGHQSRPDIFSLCVKKPAPVYSKVIEIDERIDSDGNVIAGVDRSSFLDRVGSLENSEIDAVVVVLMHAWKNSDHEIECEGLLRSEGFNNIFLSHRCVNLIKVISRGQSTLVDAYLSEVMERYVNDIKSATGDIPVAFMQSNGTPCGSDAFTGKSALLSGPAGGVIAVAGLSGRKDVKGVIGFDMGGTSTDVSRYDGKFEKIYENVIGGIPLQAEMLNIVTVAAGGGSILDFDGQKITAGPESAGAYPGPACYGFGGPLTVTDANLMTGRIVQQFFPNIFGPEGNAPLDAEVTMKKFATQTDEINRSMHTGMSPMEAAAGFLRVANEKMAMAIKEISVSKGFDVRDYALVSFGGAGGQHACSIASLLDIDTIIIHPLSSVMSAYGIGLSKPAWKSEQTVLEKYSPEANDLIAGMFGEMEKRIRKHVRRDDREYEWTRELDLRPSGTETYLTLRYGRYEDTNGIFRDQYKRLFGFVPPDSALEIVNLRVELKERSDFFPPFEEHAERPDGMAEPLAFQDLYWEGELVSAPVYQNSSLPLHTPVKGPAFIIDMNSTIVIEPDFVAELDENAVVRINRTAKKSHEVSGSSGKPDPVLLEVFNNLFMGTATEMGLALQNTAHSVNMKERFDFSCAVFDADGALVANAPHIPVHLGSMADTVRAVIEDRGDEMKPGDIYLTNNPYRGGSHLPDMTVLSPLFSKEGEIIFFTAARGHHSDVGGLTPGSMPPEASHIDEEGVLIDSLLLVRDGVFREDELKQVLLGHSYPVRNMSERIADFRAQIAACNKGASELMGIIDSYGLKTVSLYMKFIQDHAEFAVKKALYSFVQEDNVFHTSFEDRLDDGTVLKANLSIDGGKNPPETLTTVIDFSGSGPEHLSDNLNAPLSVVRSAVIYVLRTLIDADIPLNSGCLKPVHVKVPDGTVLSPKYPAPVATGNVETSQRVVDVLLGAFGIAAASQGTMNNLLFEVEGESPYYETIAGGAGALDGCPGASGVQVHMTNTRMTDPEVLEFRHPGVRIERFSKRAGTGGQGAYPGGDGVIREIRFLKSATVSVLSERRVFSPYGLHGGKAGIKGLNIHIKADGSRNVIGHRQVLHVESGDAVRIETPGGGGFGPKK